MDDAPFGQGRSMLVLVDDVQWLDDPTRDALGFVLRRLGADSVAVVFAARPGGLGELARVVQAVVDVEPLDDASATAILETAAGSIDGTARAAVLDAARWVSDVALATSCGLRWSSSSGSVPTGGPIGAAENSPRAERVCGSVM